MYNMVIDAEIKAIKEKGWFESFDVEKLIKEERIVNQRTKEKSSILKCIKKSTSPKPEKIFNALKLFNKNETKVVILGQDPYPNLNDAQGLAFSSENHEKQDSLENIFKAIDLYCKTNKKRNTNLEQWAIKYKVLLLNTALTYESDDNKIKRKHINAWQPFIVEILKELNDIDNLQVFLWGTKAHKYKSFFNNKAIKIYETKHPSKRNQKSAEKFLEKAPNDFEKCTKALGINIWSEI